MSATIPAPRPAQTGWRRTGGVLVRELAFRDFNEAFDFVRRIAEEAVDYLRRPDICVYDFNRVRLTIVNRNHAHITMAEIRLAGKVDAIIDRWGQET